MCTVRDRGASFSTSSTGLTTSDQALIFDSEQFGDLTWSPRAPMVGDVMFVAAFDGLFRSDDGAGHWQEVQTLAEYVVGLLGLARLRERPDRDLDDLRQGCVHLERSGNDVEGQPRGLGVCDRNGLTPVYRLTNVVFSPGFADDGTIFSAGAKSFLKSSDRGASWTAMTVARFRPGRAAALHHRRLTRLLHG